MTSDSEIRKLCEEVEEYCSNATRAPWEEGAYKEGEDGEVRCCVLGFRPSDDDGNAETEVVVAGAEGNTPQDSMDMEFISRARVDLPKLVAALREKLEAEREQEDGRYRAFAQAMRQWEMYADEQREESERIRETTDKEDIEAEMFQRFEATRFAWWKSLLPSSSGGEGMTIKEFYCGFAVAVGTVARNGDPACAVDAMDTNGVALRDLIDAGAEEFDLAPIRHEYKLQARNLDGHKKKLVSSPEVKA